MKQIKYEMMKKQTQKIIKLKRKKYVVIYVTSVGNLFQTLSQCDIISADKISLITFEANNPHVSIIFNIIIN